MKIRNKNKLRDMLTRLLSYPYWHLVKWLSEIEDEEQYPSIALHSAELFVSEAAPFIYLFLSLAFSKMLLLPAVEGIEWSVPFITIDLFAHNILPALADAGTMFSSAELMADKMVDLVDTRKVLDNCSVEFRRCGDAIRDIRGYVYLVRLIAAATAAILAFGLAEGFFGPLVTYIAPVLSLFIMVFACCLVASSQAWVDEGKRLDESLSEREREVLRNLNQGRRT